MNNNLVTTIVGWETRNQKKAKRAEVSCNNYGLQRLLKNLFVGKLYAKEKQALTMKLENLLPDKTDNVFVASFCGACHSNLTLMVQKKAKNQPSFEILTDE